MSSDVGRPFGARRVPPRAPSYPRLLPNDVAAPDEPIDRLPPLRPHEPEVRLAPRQRTFLAVKISYSKGQVISEGVIRNRSKLGARLQIDASLALPETFIVVMLRDLLVAEARYVWRKGADLGVAWIGEPVSILDSDNPEHRRLVRQLHLSGDANTSNGLFTSLLD